MLAPSPAWESHARQGQGEERGVRPTPHPHCAPYLRWGDFKFLPEELRCPRGLGAQALPALLEQPRPAVTGCDPLGPAHSPLMSEGDVPPKPRGSFCSVLLFCFAFVAATRGIWDLSSPKRDRTWAPCIRSASLNHWTAREVPLLFFMP